MRRMRSHEAVNAVERIGGDAAAVAQARRQLAVIDRAPAEGGFRKSGAPAVVRNLLEQLLCVHCPLPAPSAGPSKRPHPRLVVEIRALGDRSEASCWAMVNHNPAHS